MDTYAWSAEAYTNSIYTEDDIRVKRILPLVGKAGRVLDVGCLDGTIGLALKKLGNEVYGIDASEPGIMEARRRGIDASLANIEEEFPFPDGMFDLVFAGEVIEHIFDIDHLFKEFSRVLKPAGTLVLTTPNLAALGRRLLLLFNRNPHIEITFTGDDAGHIRYFVKSTLFDLLLRHSFLSVQLTSDVVNFNRKGTIRSFQLARLFPPLGRSLIVKARRG
jgi:2-polyprenyl-3-methyl-5-hydroxy-6-metoxy-1,4-benzoquinol methylase